MFQEQSLNSVKDFIFSVYSDLLFKGNAWQNSTSSAQLRIVFKLHETFENEALLFLFFYHLKKQSF